MKVTVKTLQQTSFELELDENETILSVKEKIQAKEGFDVDSQKLIYSGKILANDVQVKAIGIKEGEFLVVMVTKPAKKAEAPKPAAAPAPAPAQPAQPAAAAAPAAAHAPTTAPAAPAQEFSEDVVSKLTEMGFPRDECVAALRAAFGNPDRAVDYLMNGIPEGAGAEDMEESEPTAMEEDEEEDDDVMSDNPLAFLLNQEEFLQMRAAVQANPQLLQPLLQHLGQTQPDLLRLINDNQDHFLDVINDTSLPDEGGAGGFTVQVTQEEKEAIDRLVALGFDRQMAIEAYFACDKNETLAANYLMDQGNWS